MSNILFDTPGPRARTRHRIYAGIFVLFSLGILAWVIQKFSEEGLLTSEVFNGVWSNTSLRYLWEGFQGTLKAAALSIVLAIATGALLAVGRLSSRRWLRWPCLVWTEFFRAVPLVLLIIFFFFWMSLSKDIEPFVALVIGLTLYNGAVLAEVFRAGILAVPKGQSEAAYAIGMRKSQVMTTILMPQAVKFMLPAIISQSVIILKDTALGFVVLYDEVVRRAKTISQTVPDGAILTYLTVAVWFIVINYALSKLAEYLERRLARRGQGKEAETVEAVAVDTGA
jgi:glutamate transport system permease protein